MRAASIGAGVSAVAMGACGYLLSDRAILFFTAILVARRWWHWRGSDAAGVLPWPAPLQHEQHATLEVGFRHPDH